MKSKEINEPSMRLIVRADKSPMNPKIWCYELECGHDVFLSGRKVTKKQIPCKQCEKELINKESLE